MAEVDVDMVAADSGVPELDEMKKRLKEMEDEAAALREMQAKVEKEMGLTTNNQDLSAANANQANKEEVDARSVFVGNVSAKRTNVPGMKIFRGRRSSPYMGSPSRVPYMAAPYFSAYGYGKVPRFRTSMRYSPYY